MAVENIYERRAYIKGLLDEGKRIDIKALAREWNSSHPAIVTDIAVCSGKPRPYKNKSAVATENIRAKKLGVDGKLTEDGWKRVLAAHNNACAYCGSQDRIAIDHIIPLSKGGLNIDENIQPLCKSCNSSKRDRLDAAARENGKRGGRPKKHNEDADNDEAQL